MRHYQSTVVTRVKISHRIRLPLVLGSKPAWFFGVLLLMIVSTGLLPAAATQISGLESPQSFLADPATNSYFISNVNGDPGVRDNNGFITKLNGNAEVIGFKFIHGGQNDTTLHAPKGMALIDNILYVADVDNHESAVASALPIARALAPRSPSLLALEGAILDGRVPQRAGLERAVSPSRTRAAGTPR